MSVATAKLNQHREGPRPRVPAPNKFTAKRLTQAGRDLVAFLVWEGGTLSKAADHLKLSKSWVAALAASPPVIQHHNAELEVRRKGERSRNFTRLLELREQEDNRAAAVSAIKVLEQIDETARTGGVGVRDVSPGFVIQVNVATHAPTHADAKPVIEHDNAANTGLDDVLYIDGRGEDVP